MSLKAFTTKMRSLPARTASFSGAAGPVACIGVDSSRNGAPDVTMDALKKGILQRGCDLYTRVEWYDDMQQSIERPPPTAAVLPAVDCGIMTPGPDDAASLVDDAVRSVVGGTAEKGYVPFVFGSGMDVLAPSVEAVKAITREDFFIAHFGSNSLMESDDAPLSKLLRDGHVRNVLQMGTRGINKATRQCRKAHQTRYIDCNALYDKAFQIKDIRNQFPCFLVVDIGIMDLAFAPGVSDNEPGGITFRDLLHLVECLRGTRIVGMLLGGFDPRYDVRRGTRLPEDGVTAQHMAKLVKEMICKVYTMTTMTHQEGYDHVREQIAQGKAVEKYPDH